jgi:hypothetical protein
VIVASGQGRDCGFKSPRLDWSRCSADCRNALNEVLPALVIANFSQWTRGWRREENRKEGEHPDMDTGKCEIVFEIGVVVYVEILLKWNNISGVHMLSTPGQFMPFFIALAQLITTFYRIGKYALFQSMEEDNGDPEGKFLLSVLGAR